MNAMSYVTNSTQYKYITLVPPHFINLDTFSTFLSAASIMIIRGLIILCWQSYMVVFWQEIPPPPRDPITFTQPATTTATPRPVQTEEQNNAFRDRVNQSESRAEQRRQRKLKRQERRRNRRNRNSPRPRARDQLTRRGGLISSLLGGTSGADSGADETTET